MAVVVNTNLGVTGDPVVFKQPPWPPKKCLVGRFVEVTPFDIGTHAEPLFTSFGDTQPELYHFVGYGPFATLADFTKWLNGMYAANREDPQFYAISTLDPATKKRTVCGIATYLRINPSSSSIEIGHIVLGPGLQRTKAATEALFLLMQNAFDLGYRRLEWKTNARNKKSIAAGLRLGFSYEGVFRQMRVDKGRNRDTAWLACMDWEWPRQKAAILQWLDDANFDEQGRQRRSLSSLTAGLLHWPAMRPKL